MGALLVGLLWGCNANNDQPGLRDLGPSLRVVVLADSFDTGFRDGHAPLMAYLGRTLAIPVELTVATDYRSVIDAFGRSEYDLAYLDAATFVDVHDAYGAVPLVMQDTEAAVESYLVTAASETGQSLEDFEGLLRLAFGPYRSVSGHWMPRGTLQDRGFVPEEFFQEVVYAESHEQTVRWVLDGVVEVGAVPAGEFDLMVAEGQVGADVLSVAAISPLFARAVWAVPYELTPDVEERIGEAFLSISRSDPAHKSLLDALSSDGFLPVNALLDFQEFSLAYLSVERVD